MIHMETKAGKVFLKIIGFLGSLLLTLFTGMFAMITLAALYWSIVDKDLISVFGCLVAGTLTYVTYNVRRNTL